MKELNVDDFTRIFAISRFRVKIKSLAAEARIIRAEKGKRRGLIMRSDWGDKSICQMLDAHNKEFVRAEARHTLLAYAYLRNRQYAQVENPADGNRPSLDRISKMLDRFGVKTKDSELRNWYAAKPQVEQVA